MGLTFATLPHQLHSMVASPGVEYELFFTTSRQNKNINTKYTQQLQRRRTTITISIRTTTDVADKNCTQHIIIVQVKYSEQVEIRIWREVDHGEEDEFIKTLKETLVDNDFKKR